MSTPTVTLDLLLPWMRQVTRAVDDATRHPDAIRQAWVELNMLEERYEIGSDPAERVRDDEPIRRARADPEGSLMPALPPHRRAAIRDDLARLRSAWTDLLSALHDAPDVLTRVRSRVAAIRDDESNGFSLRNAATNLLRILTRRWPVADVTLPDAVMDALVKSWRRLNADLWEKQDAWEGTELGSDDERVAAGEHDNASGWSAGFDLALDLLGIRAAVAARAAQEVDDG